MSGKTTERRQGLAALAALVNQIVTAPEVSPVASGPALVAHLNQRMAAIERRIQTLEARS